MNDFGTLILINLLGGVAMLLWGVRMVHTGVVRGWGPLLKNFIERGTRSRITAAISGSAATLFLQSSTATAMIAAGLAETGLLAPAAGLAVLLGADAGSSLVAGIFGLGGNKISILSPILIAAGYVTFSSSNGFRAKNAGRILFGLGLMLLALQLISTATVPLRDASLFHMALSTVAREPVLALIAGALATWASYSTLAMVLLIMSFVAAGSLEPAGAAALVLGINLGGGLPAVSATFGQPANARRLPMANLACRATLALAAAPFAGSIINGAAVGVGVGVAAVAASHIAFNLVLVLTALPLAGPIMRAMYRLMPAPKTLEDPLATPRYLDDAALVSPTSALVNAQTEAARMTELLERMLQMIVDALTTGNVEHLKGAKQTDRQINAYQKAIQEYLARLPEAEMSPDTARRIQETLLFVSNLEHAGDIVHLNLADRARAKAKGSLSFNAEQTADILHLVALVQSSLKLASGVMISRDVGAARRLAEQKDQFRSHENTILDAHFRKSASGRGTDRSAPLFVDLIRDLHRFNSHIVSAAYPILDEAGLLRETRIRGMSTPED